MYILYFLNVYDFKYYKLKETYTIILKTVFMVLQN